VSADERPTQAQRDALGRFVRAARSRQIGEAEGKRSEVSKFIRSEVERGFRGHDLLQPREDEE
jgi:hypothetical protein